MPSLEHMVLAVGRPQGVGDRQLPVSVLSMAIAGASAASGCCAAASGCNDPSDIAWTWAACAGFMSEACPQGPDVGAPAVSAQTTPSSLFQKLLRDPTTGPAVLTALRPLHAPGPARGPLATPLRQAARAPLQPGDSTYINK